MDIFLKEHQQFLLLLIKHKVQFMLIGGYAVIYYGYERTTGDLDIWLQPTNENKKKLVNALMEYNIEEENIQQLMQLNFEDVQLFFIGEIPRRIDFLTKINIVKFDEALLVANYFDLEMCKIPVIHFNHLILSKISTGRAKDKADIEELQRINKFRK